jgi:hypothetical protein
VKCIDIRATEFGGGDETGMDSAYGGKVDSAALQASLPARLPANRRQIRIVHRPSGRSLICRVNDVGPWNTTDDYWTNGRRPLSEAQYQQHTEAENGRVPSNDAGIDLTPAVFDLFKILGPINSRSMRVDWEFV